MTEINETLLEKVRALLAKAESTEHPPEAEALTAKATELMAKYGIEQAMLADKEPGRGEVANKMIDVPNPYGIDKATLLQGIAKATGSQGVRLRGKNVRVHLFGYASDLERAELLYTSLLVQSANALVSTPAPHGVSTVSFRKAFLAGFTKTVIERLEAAERKAAQEAAPLAAEAGRSVALVLADRSVAVNSALTTAYPNIRQMTRRFSSSGFNAGSAAGRRADLGGARVGSGRRAIGR